MTKQVACGKSILVKDLCKALNIDIEKDLVSEITISLKADGYLIVKTLKYMQESNLKDLVETIDTYDLSKFKY